MLPLVYLVRSFPTIKKVQLDFYRTKSISIAVRQLSHWKILLSGETALLT